MTKILTHRQVRWSEYLSRFNLIICFRPRKLRTKHDALTRQWDVYLKEGNSNYATANPQNLRPVFTSEQLASSLRATALSIPVICRSLIMDTERLHVNIKSQLLDDPVSVEHLDSRADLRWTLGPNGLLRHSGCIYVPDSSLCLRVLQYSHDHPLAGHYGQSKTLYQVRLNYYWPRLPTYVKNYCSHAPPFLVPNPCATDHMGFSSSFPFLRGHGTPSPWIS